MNPDERNCAHCGKPLALADRACASCGTPVPPERRLAILAARAEAFAADEDWADAARAAEAVLELAKDGPDAKLWWRKRASWLQRTGQPGLLDPAEAALAEALRLDDGDDLSHQLWIDLLQRRGELDKARGWYKQRLEINPEDGIAKKHLAALRLLADFKIAPPPKLALADSPDGFFMKMLRPTAWKMATAALGLLFCLVMLIHGGGAPPAAAPLAAPPPGSDEAMVNLAGGPAGDLGALMKVAADPMSNVVQIVLYALYIFWGVKARRAR